MAPPPTHRQRAAPRLHRLLRRARPHGGAVGQPDPARPDGAVHRRRHGAVQAVLHRRRGAAVPPGHGQRAEVRAGRRQAQRPRRRRPHHAPPRLLRDARQLQLRRLLQGADAIPWAWELVTEVLGLDGDRIWITVHTVRRRGRADLARRRRRADGAHPAPRRQGQLLADGRHGPVRAVLRAAHRQGPRVRPRRRPAGRPGRRALRRDLEPRLHAVRPGAGRHADAAAPAVDRHRRRASSAS